MLNLDTTYAALHAELRKPNIGVALVWRVVRLDGQTFYYTDHDAEIIAPEFQGDSPGLTFSPLSPFAASAKKQTEGLAVDNITLTGFIDGGSPAIGPSEAEVLAEIWSDAAVTIWLCVWTNPSVGLLPLNEGTLGPMKFRTHTFEAEFRSIAERLQRPVHRTYTITCDAVLGDTRCGVDLNGSPALKQTVTVTSVSDNRTFNVSLSGETAQYFQYGLARWTSGNNNTLRREVISQTIDTSVSPAEDSIKLLVPMPYDVEVGDTIELTVGCDKRFATCRDKFSNSARFRGFPLIPTKETLLDTPDAQ